MSPEHGALRKVEEDLFCGRNVRRQHELLHHRVRLEDLLGLHVDGIGRLAVHSEPDIGDKVF